MFGVRKPAAAPCTDRWWRSADGLKLHARDYAPASGDARLPVVCIHGLTRNARDFEGVAPIIAGWGRRVLALDVRGRGESDRDSSPMNYHPGVYASDVMELMQAAGLSRAQFIGTSMGGLITMTLASVRGDLVAGAVLNDIGPDLAPGGLARIAAYVGQTSEVKTWKQAEAYVRSTNGPAHPLFSAHDWAIMARRLFKPGPGGRPVLDYDAGIAIPIRAAASAPTPDLWPYYKTLTSQRRLLIIRGEISDLLDAATVKRMVDLEPDAMVQEIPKVGHAPTLEEPLAVAALKRFFEAAD